MATITTIPMISKCVIVGLGAAAMLIQLATAANYTVGGSNGSWDTATDLQTWASSQKFHVGDNLVFQYTANHNLLEVSMAGYDSCQVSNALQSYSDGNTVISLSSPGKRYFICGMPGHCLQGMKVEIDTSAAASSSSPSASAPSPTSVTSPASAAPAPAPGAASPALAVSNASPPSPPASPSLSPAALPSDVPSTESPIPTTSSIPPQPSQSSSSASRNSFLTSLALGFTLIAILMRFAF